MVAEKHLPYSPRSKPSQKAIRRAVASSTALETDQSVEAIELKLRSKQLDRFSHLSLAD